MAKPKLTFVTPFGTFTRETARPYKFVILVQAESEGYLRRMHKIALDASRANLPWLESKASGTQPLSYGETVEKYVEHVAASKAWIADEAAHLEKKLGEARARWESGEHKALGFSTKLELARKEAQKAAEIWDGVKVVDFEGKVVARFGRQQGAA